MDWLDAGANSRGTVQTYVDDIVMTSLFVPLDMFNASCEIGVTYAFVTLRLVITGSSKCWA
ncbi:hypothetical protein FRX31_006806 [Thalictrum thalictroides]|uniref:Uncharacterized protein n=1 Tax=Thalictrum thalictroides TaxID=46969 RepID=A0A7J6X3D3_THATH|nr:hypothetical protein FRX31_006806 [Thalictrum thalictroides]